MRAGRALLMLAGLAVWAVLPLTGLVAHALRHDLTLTGADGLFASDQLQYMGWVRDFASHLLASNKFDSVASDHVFLHPLFFLSGVALKLGVSIQVAVLMWKPVAIAVLFLGSAAYVRHHLGLDRPSGAAALVLALFVFVPFGLLLRWGHLVHGRPTDQLTALGSVMSVADDLSGEPHLVIAVGLMPFFVLALERALSHPDARHRRTQVAWAGTLGLAVSWLHPWQGLTLLVVLVGVAVWGRELRRVLSLGSVAALTAAPLVYYYLLPREDTAWRVAEVQGGSGRYPLWVLFVVLGPLVPLAIAGCRGRAATARERALRIWPAAVLVSYFAASSGAFHSFEGISLPLAVLCVRGWIALRLPAVLAAATMALVVLPGQLWELRSIRSVQGYEGFAHGYYLTRDEDRALAYLQHVREPGAVLARSPVAVVVPGATGRSTWVAHPIWTPDYDRRARRAEALFAGQLSAARARRTVVESRAGFLLSDCPIRPSLRRQLGRLVTSERRFGCVAVYEVRS